MTERLLGVDDVPREDLAYRHLWVGDERATRGGLNHDLIDAIAAELDRLYAAAEANQAPGPDWKAKLREEVQWAVTRGNYSSGFVNGLRWVLSLIDALPDPPTPDPDAPPVYVPPEGHVAVVLGRDVPDGWEGRTWLTEDHWFGAETCRSYPDVLFEVRRVPAPEPTTEWVPLTKLVGRTIKGETEPVVCPPFFADGRWHWQAAGGGHLRDFPDGTLNLDTACVEVLAEGER